MILSEVSNSYWRLQKWGFKDGLDSRGSFSYFLETNKKKKKTKHQFDDSEDKLAPGKSFQKTAS